MAREFLSTILKNATRMNRLTEDLLTMARVESPEAEMHPAPVRADVLVRDAVEAMRGLVQERRRSWRSARPRRPRCSRIRIRCCRCWAT